MTPRRNTPQSNQSDSNLDALFEEGTEEAKEPAPPKDPADIAACLLLTHALSTAKITLETARRNGTVFIVEIPAPEWQKPIRRAWQCLVRSGESPLSSEFGLRQGGAGWVAWTPEPGSRPDRWDPDMVALALAAGYQCVGIVANPDTLPEDLRDAADHQVTIPPLAAADVAELVRALCGSTPTEVLSDVDAAQLTPRLLRLAYRPNQATDVYVGRLRVVTARVRAKAAPASQTPRDAPTLDRLHGMDDAVAWGQRLAHDIGEYRAGKLPWSAVDRGVLLSGPPGCGKTLFARALAASCAAPLFTGSYGEWLGTNGGHQGSLLRAMRAVFAQAKKAAPAIIFIDEIDSFPNRATLRHAYASWDIQVENALLAEIDGADARIGVVLIAACNHPWKLDPALVRSGRLDRHIRIGLPDAKALALILHEHLRDDLAGEDLSRVALLALGNTGADCERAVRGARQRARLAKRPMLLADLLAEIDGEEVRTGHELHVAAVHEAGHAVASVLLQPGSVQMVSLRSQGDTGGVTISRKRGACQTLGEIKHFLVRLLAGRAAEEVILGFAFTGAGGERDSDLASATGLAAAAIASYGLVADAGMVWLTTPDQDEVLRLVRRDPGLVAHVRCLLDEAHDAALQLLERHRVCVEAVAEALLNKRILTGAEVEAIVRRLTTRREAALVPTTERPPGPPSSAGATDPGDTPSPAHSSH